MKAVLDRFYALGKYSRTPHVSLVEGKRCVLVTTAAAGPEDGTDLTAESYRRLMRFMRMKRCGELKVTDIGAVEATRVDEELRRRASVGASSNACRADVLSKRRSELSQPAVERPVANWPTRPTLTRQTADPVSRYDALGGRLSRKLIRIRLNASDCSSFG